MAFRHRNNSGRNFRSNRGRRRSSQRDSHYREPHYGEPNHGEPQLETMVEDMPERPDGEIVTGVLDILPEGFGFLRCAKTFEPVPGDPYVSTSQIRGLRLREGSMITGPVRNPRKREKHPSLQSIDLVEGVSPEAAGARPLMHDLTPLVPTKRLRVEHDPAAKGTRIIDLLVPIGAGQRGVIVAPPKAGKTMLLQEIAKGVTINHPEMPLFILLIDERPEEVTDFVNTGHGQVLASSFDSSPQSHLRIAELALQRCLRLVEAGKDVFLLLDSLTRLTRTANVANRGTGRSLSGGLDPSALQFPRKLLGAARSIENGGSLTILATALVETDSRMDEVIFEEFKGTGNWELKLDRKLADRRIFPAFDLSLSGTRREEMLYTPDENLAVRHLRRSLLDSSVNPMAQMEQIIRLLDKHKTNDDIVHELMNIIR